MPLALPPVPAWCACHGRLCNFLLSSNSKPHCKPPLASCLLNPWSGRVRCCSPNNAKKTLSAQVLPSQGSSMLLMLCIACKVALQNLRADAQSLFLPRLGLLLAARPPEASDSSSTSHMSYNLCALLGATNPQAISVSASCCIYAGQCACKAHLANNECIRSLCSPTIHCV